MARIIAITNQKGGVGKTTTSINIAASLVATKRKVLLVDLDPQGNATSGCGVDKAQQEQNVLDVLLGDLSAEQVIQPAVNGGFDLLAANGDLSAADVHLMELENKESRLKTALKAVQENYDYIFIDCPPSLNMLTVNALVASGSVLIPMQCEYYALEGISSLMDTINQIVEHVNPDLEIEGILRTMYDPRNRLATEVSNQLHEYFGDKVYRSVIPRNVRLAEAPSYGMPALQYDRLSTGAKCYLALAGEIIRRQEQKEPPLAVTNA
ncbi:ParA family protein [Pleionea mediterranea]|uniref:Chromosome partitioning protein n=1 Tax=Pleionea mediterranea TaxID=523701 RepID=A0A316FXG5_9GAMM|nr:ParA family protein [Pleionea mediterranea]PWK46777.1 chromosome partitioning protein [Pleionea mediterranea]